MERAALEDAVPPTSLPAVGAAGDEEVPQGHELAWAEGAASATGPVALPPGERPSSCSGDVPFTRL